MKKLAFLLLTAIVFASSLALPCAHASSVTLSFNGGKSVKKGGTYAYTYTVTMQNACEFEISLKCAGAEISGDTTLKYSEDAFTNTNVAKTGQIQVSINETAVPGNEVTITATGRYCVVSDAGIPGFCGIPEESYTLTVVADEAAPAAPAPESASAAEAPAGAGAAPPSASGKPSPPAADKPVKAASPSAPASPINDFADDLLPLSASHSAWEALSLKLDALSDGGTAVVAVNPSSVESVPLPSVSLKALKAKRATLVIDFGDYTCTIDGTKLGNALTEPVTLTMTMDRVEAISEAAGKKDLYQLHFKQQADMPGCLTYGFKAFGNRPGDILSLYAYHDASGLAEYKQSVAVGDDNCAAFEVYEGGSYFVAAAPDDPATGQQSQADAPGSAFLTYFIPALCIIAAAVALAVSLRRRKRSRR